MKEKCPSCGNEIYQNSKYCGNCGMKIKRDNNTEEDLEKTIIIPVNPPATINNENSNKQNTNVEGETEQYKTSSLVLSILGIFLPIIFSIIGLILGIAYKNKYKKTCAGFVISIIVLILRLLLFIFIVIPIAILIVSSPPYEMSKEYEYNNNYDNSEYNYNNNQNENTGTTRTVGTDEYGYVKVPTDWIKFFDPEAPQTFQYSYLMSYIITLYAYDKSITDPYLLANNLKIATEQKGVSVNMTPTTIDKYNAYKLEYLSEGVWLNIYFFKAEDNKVHYISIEGPDKNSEYFNIPKTFKLKNTEV